MNTRNFFSAMKPYWKKAMNYVALVLVILSTFFIGVTYGMNGRIDSNSITSTFRNAYRDRKISNVKADLLWEVLDTAAAKYFGDIDGNEVLYGSIKGAIAGIGDRYTVFNTPDESKDFNDSLEGVYDGIGIEIDIVEGHLVVVSPLSGSPAEKAGLRPGDEILAVDGESVDGKTLVDVTSKIKGPTGTSVKLTLVRGSGSAFVVEIVRETIRQDSVELDVDANKLATIKIFRFASETRSEFERAINEAIAKGARGIVLDLRNNPGGYLDAGVAVANTFLRKGMVVVEERFRDGKTDGFSADGTGKLPDLPLVVLVNRGSASASEIVAGAIKDNFRGAIVGEKTYGKGSVQEMEKFADGSSLKITVAKWFTPKGTSISEEGIVPDVEAIWDAKAKDDTQLKAAKTALQDAIVKAKTSYKRF